MATEVVVVVLVVAVVVVVVVVCGEEEGRVCGRSRDPSVSGPMDFQSSGWSTLYIVSAAQHPSQVGAGMSCPSTRALKRQHKDLPESNWKETSCATVKR